MKQLIIGIIRLAPLNPIVLLFVLAAMPFVPVAQQVIPLYNGPAPGSENWNWEEKEFFVKSPLNAKIAYNVVNPTLTVFAPDTSNGAAVIIFPGGGFHVVNFESEGIAIAKELTKKGITVFVLKYRVVRSLTDDPWQETLTSMKDTATNRRNIRAISPLARADAMRAIRIVRQQAVNQKLDPKKIGILGFSAGGSLVITLSTNYTEEAQPAFAGIIYSPFRPEHFDPVTSKVPPAFIAGSTDDALAPSSQSANLYNAWIAAGVSAELHIYSTGGHGLKAGNSSTWIYRFEEWLTQQGFLKHL